MKFWEKLEDILTPFEFLAFLCLGFVAIDIPLALAFQHKPSSFETAADILISVILGLEFFRYQTKNQIAPHQNGTRAMELIAAVPFLAICTTLLAIDSNIAIYLQGFHLLRAPRLISTMLNRNKDKILPKRFKFLVAGFITTVVLNTFACGWLLIYPANEDTHTAYIKALYWLVTTIATVGYGDITPSTNGGRVYAMFMMVMGATIWGVLIASASRMMLASDQRKEKRKEKMASLQSFFNHYEIPKQLQGQVVGFYNHLLTQKLSEDERAVMSELPTALQGELQVYMNLKPISRISLFQGVSFVCLSQIAKRLEQVFYAPGEAIIHKGEIGNEMFLIGHGSVTIHIDDHFIANVGEGQCFGEFALIENTVRTTDVTAASYCDMFKLPREKFDELFKAHPDLRANIERIVQDRKNKPSTPPSKGMTNPTRKAG